MCNLAAFLPKPQSLYTYSIYFFTHTFVYIHMNIYMILKPVFLESIDSILVNVNAILTKAVNWLTTGLKVSC